MRDQLARLGTRLALGMSIGVALEAWRPEAATLWTLIGAIVLWRRVSSWNSHRSSNTAG